VRGGVSSGKHHSAAAASGVTDLSVEPQNPQGLYPELRERPKRKEE